MPKQPCHRSAPKAYSTIPTRRIALLALALALVPVVPAPARAQPPPLLLTWGTFGTGDDQFKTPVGVAVDVQGNVYVADSNNNRVQKFSSNGQFISKWGSRGDGPGQFAVDSPAGLAVDPPGNVFTTDPNHNRIEKFANDGTLLIQIPYWGTGIACDAAGNVYEADRRTGAGAVRKFSNDGALVLEIDQFADGVAVDAGGNIYAANAPQIFEYSPAGVLLRFWGSYGSGNGQFGSDSPTRLSVGPNGLVYAVDYFNNRIQVFTPDGQYLAQWGGPGIEPGQFRNPIGIAVDAYENVYVADTNNSRIQKFGRLPTPALAMSWGRLKRAYR